MRRLALLGLCALLSVACFDPQVPAGLLCDKEEATACPPGQVCDTAKHCCKPIGGSCGESPDQSTTSADLAPVSGCAFGGGVQLAEGLWACKGIWSSGMAATLCRARLAKASDVTQAAVSECAKQPGFFVVQDQIWPSEPKSGSCQPPEVQSCTSVSPVTITYRLGCGGYTTPKNVRSCAIKCGQLSQAIVCFGPGSGYTCTSNSLDDKNTDPMMGVLCAG